MLVQGAISSARTRRAAHLQHRSRCQRRSASRNLSQNHVSCKFTALVDILASATAVLDDIAVHASRALSKWRLSASKQPRTWGSLTKPDRKRYEDFAELCACQIAVATVDFFGLLTPESRQLHDLIARSKQIIAESQDTADRLV